MKHFNFSSELLELADKTEQSLVGRFRDIDRIAECNIAKVHRAFMDMRVSESHFAGTTGYGYGDRGRDVADKVYARVFGAGDAIVRYGFASGTHAISTALFAVLRPGDRMVCLTGRPYDTLHNVIGLSEDIGNIGSLRDYGIEYSEFDFCGGFDGDTLSSAVCGARVVYIQKSRGYSLRPSLTCDYIGRLIKAAKESAPNAVVIVDNCYGEFAEETEPCDHGADLIIGSLIKNAGGGIARTGGYIAGNPELIELCGYRLTSPGTGREVGCSLGSVREILLGLYLAPQIVSNAIKTNIFALRLFEDLGFEVFPRHDEIRADIIGAIKLGDNRLLTAFCQGIQQGSPIDSFVTPEGSAMPGYDSQVIMAAGTFTMGSSIELSADAPLREPYAVWLQGGMTYAGGKIGILTAAERIMQLL
ncbi:MAG: methionine gamma-lyase family protein [Oscillospiraceae bacterium]|nr:methionine gamma-lyase family protein [Oscillospiraceae bacterium]